MAINERDIFWDWQAACEQQDVEAQKELAHYVLEDLNEIAKIFHEAKAYLKDPSFYAYESDDPPRRAREEVKALYECLQDRKPKAGGDYLAYVLEDVKSVRVRGKQRIRLAREVLFWGHGVCLDWVLLFAACIFHAHIYPLIIVTREHAVLGYWLREDEAKTFGQVVLSGADVKRLFDEQRIKVINATRIPPAEDSKLKPFDEAEEEAETHLPYALFAVDIRKAREKGIKPLLPLDPWSRNHTLPPAEHFQWRPELEEIKNWWRHEDSYGVLALIGIGGAGKTALARRFLAQLPNSDIQDPKVGKDETLPVPDALFVWDFYTHPDVDQCATELYNYLTQKQADKATFEQVQDVLSRNWRGCRVLLVFDGVEKLQISPGTEPEKEGGTFGQFFPKGRPLARFLQWCCDSLRSASVIVCSRFPLNWQGHGYRSVKVDELPRDSAREILRFCGVTGGDKELDNLINEFGNHALTLNLLGRALATFCGGLASRAREIPSLMEVGGTLDLDNQSWRLRRVLRFYEQKLSAEGLTLLQRISVFQRPMEEGLLVKLLSSLTGLKQFEVKRHLVSLSEEYHLLEVEVRGNKSKKWYVVHSAVRDYFYYLQADPLPVHESARKFIGSLLERRETPLPKDEPTLDLLEELLFHTIRTGAPEEALSIYLNRLRGLRDGRTPDGYERGERITRMFFESACSPELLPGFTPQRNDWVKLLYDRGLFLARLGQLENSITYFSAIIEKVLEEGDCFVFIGGREPEEALGAYSMLTSIHMLRGFLRKAEKVADKFANICFYWEFDEDQKPASEAGIRARCIAAVVKVLLGKWSLPEAVHYVHVFHGWPGREVFSLKDPDLFLPLLGRKVADFSFEGCSEPYLSQKLSMVLDRSMVVMLGARRYRGKELLYEGGEVCEQSKSIHECTARSYIALNNGNIQKATDSVAEGLNISKRYGFVLHWITLLNIQARLLLDEGRFIAAERAARMALNGQLKNSDEPAPQPDLPEDQLVMLGARHPECGYAWGEGDALHILAEARFELAQCIGPEGHDSEGRSYEQLLEEARQAAGEALALRKRIQDPKAKETWDLLRRIQECENDSR